MRRRFHYIDAGESASYELLAQAFCVLPSHFQANPNNRFYIGRRALLAFQAGYTVRCKNRGLERAVNVPAFFIDTEPLGVKVERMLGLDRELVLTSPENWLLLDGPDPFIEPEAAVVIMNIGRLA